VCCERLPKTYASTKRLDKRLAQRTRVQARRKPNEEAYSMRSNCKLMEVGKDFDIVIRGWSGKPQYKVRKKIVLETEIVRISSKKLKQIIADLQKRYPDKGYFLVRERVRYCLFADIMVDSRYKSIPVSLWPWRLWPWRRGIFWIMGRKQEGVKGIPIYYSSSLHRLYVPSSYVKRNYRLTCSALSYRLRDLGLSHRFLTL
jgi:hypothetical protein